MRLGVFLFAVAAPIVAMIGYGIIGSVPVLSSPVGVAVCLLVSGGTFLYAACIHILPEALHTSERSHQHPLTPVQASFLFILFSA